MEIQDVKKRMVLVAGLCKKGDTISDTWKPANFRTCK
jgi:hypothetical protein